MAWCGECNIAKYTGIRGVKCLLVLVKDEINALRVALELPEYTWEDILAKMDAYMTTYEENEGE